ncbi:hypothetical protein BH11BAC4_BH11BAC4_04940 [soil metagenome]
MITIIMLTVIALSVLLIGFFEIRIPFIHNKNSSKKEEFLFDITRKANKSGKTQIRKIKHLLKDAKNEMSYRLVNDRKTSDIV